MNAKIPKMCPHEIPYEQCPSIACQTRRRAFAPAPWLDRLAEFIAWGQENDGEVGHMEVEYDNGYIISVGFENKPKPYRTLEAAVKAAVKRWLKAVRDEWKRDGPGDDSTTKLRREFAKRLAEVIRAPRSNRK